MSRQCHLSLLVPALAAPLDMIEEAVVDRTPVLEALQTLLARSAAEKLPFSGLEAQLFHLFEAGVPGKDLPVAALTYLLDSGKRSSGWRIRCDPVNLVPGHNSLILAGSENLDVSDEETDIIIGQLNEFYSEKGWHFEALTASRWYLSLAEPPGLQTCPLPDVLGFSIEQYLPRGEDAGDWHVKLAEIQMLLHGSEVNHRRESCGKPVINSLWFWGGGTLPVVDGGRWDCVWSNDVVSRALASVAAVHHRPVPESASQWLKSAPEGEQLLVLDCGRYISRFGDQFAWLELLQLLDKNWFAPLLMALKKGELDSLDLYTGGDRVFHITRRSLRRWWRRRRDILSRLAANG